MFAIKSKIEGFVRTVLIAVILFNALTPTSALAKSLAEHEIRSESPASTQAENTDEEKFDHKNNSTTNLQSELGQPDITQSTVDITPSGQLQANGTQAATITVTVKDANAIPVPNTKVVLDVAGDGTQIQYVNDQTDINGVLTAQLTSNLPGAKTVRVGILTSTQTLWHKKTLLVVFRGAEISGIIFNDKNSNGEFNPDENGVVGIQVKLLDSQNTVTASTISNFDGHYTFDGLQAGNYHAVIEPNNSYDSSSDLENVSLNAFDLSGGHDFGLFETAAVSGEVWDDVNQDQIIDANELKLGNVTINGSSQNSPNISTNTQAAGNYLLKLPAILPSGPANFNFDALLSLS